MKLLLIQPPVQDFYRTSIRTQPIGLAYLAAAVRDHGWDVEILDCQTRRSKSIPIPKELLDLKDYYPFEDRSPFRLYTGYYHFGMNWDEIRRRIFASEADVFGISSCFSPYHAEAVEIARIVKTWDRRKVTIFGGSHASCDPEGVLSDSSVDYVIQGEGEARLPALLEAIRSGSRNAIGEIDGCAYRTEGGIHLRPLQTFIQDLDGLSRPARDLLDPDRYRLGKKRSSMLITSRGCPHGCAYCSAHLVMGTGYRTRSPESVLQEMMECRERFGIQVFDIEDDNFTFDQGRAKELLRLIVANFGEGGVELTAMNGLSFASLDEELLELMRKAGVKTINLSFVTVDGSMIERMRRPGGSTRFERILGAAGRLGLNVVAYAILGIPGQTIGEMVDTLVYLMGQTVLIGPSVYYPTPGTPLFEKCKEEGVLPAGLSRWRSTAIPVETRDFDRLDMITLFRLVRTINFLKGCMDRDDAGEGLHLGEIFRMIKEGDPLRLHSFRDDREGGISLLRVVFEERSFFGATKTSTGDLRTFKQPTSKRVFDLFLERAWDKPVLKSRHVPG
jgi:radical SAM superfamily enzyme YgiQ (UPF0313 family)